MAHFEIDLEADTGDNAAGDPVPVRIVRDDTVNLEENQAANFASWESNTTGAAGAVNPAVQILPQAPKRKRATIQVSPGLVAGATAGYVLLGNRKEDVQNGGGARYYNGQKIDYEAQPAVWMIGDGTNDLSVSVEDERYK